MTLLELTEPWPLADEVLPVLWAMTVRVCYQEDAAVADSAFGNRLLGPTR